MARPGHLASTGRCGIVVVDTGFAVSDHLGQSRRDRGCSRRMALLARGLSGSVEIGDALVGYPSART